jgi:hypothetical protein
MTVFRETLKTTDDLMMEYIGMIEYIEDWDEERYREARSNE